MAVMHTLSSSTPPSPEAGADVIVGQPGLAAAMSGLDRPFVMMMVMVRSWNLKKKIYNYMHIYIYISFYLRNCKIFYQNLIIAQGCNSILLIYY